MKKFLTLCLVAILAVVSQAQNIMTLHLKNAAPVEIETSRIDSMRWEEGITLCIYFTDHTTASYPLTDFDQLSWSLPELPDDPVTVGNVELGTGEQYIINDSLTTVVAHDCTVEFSPTVADEDTKVVIRSATSAPPVYVESEYPDEEPIAISQNAKTVDVKLDGITDLDGTVEIRIPIRPSDGSIPSAAYYNETTNEWESVDYSYDTAKGEVVILTNHLSIYSAYEIKNEHTRNARMVFYNIPSHNVSTEEMAEMVLKIAAKNRDEMIAAVEECYGTISQLGLDIGYSAFNSTGMEVRLIEKYKEDLGTVSTLLSCYDIIRAGLKGDNETAGLNTMKLALSQATNAMSEAIGTGIMTAAMCGVAIIDYALNKMWETAWNDRKQLYRNMYELYYQKHPVEGLKQHYMSAKDWYKKLLPIFKQGAPTVDGVKSKVEDIINDYVWEFWNLPESEFEMYWFQVTNLPWSYYGGLNETIKKDLADWHRNELHKTKFPIVFERIGEEMELDNYVLLKNGMKDYATFMNQVITLRLAVTNTADPSADLTGYKVRFKNLPNSITDPAKWKANLDAAGKGYIKFRLYAYAVEGVTPTLEVVSPNGKVVAEQDITINEGSNNIAIDFEDDTYPRLKLSKSEVEFSGDGGQEKIDVETNVASLNVSASETWLSASYNAQGKTLVVTTTKNTNQNGRVGEITVKAENAAGSVTRTVIVKQDGQEDAEKKKLWEGVNFTNFSISGYVTFLEGGGPGFYCGGLSGEYVGNVVTSSSADAVIVEVNAVKREQRTYNASMDSIVIRARIDKKNELMSVTISKNEKNESRAGLTRHLYEYSQVLTLDSVPLYSIRKLYNNAIWPDGTEAPALITSAINASLDPQYVKAYHYSMRETYWQLPADYWDNPSLEISGTLTSTAKNMERKTEDVKRVTDFILRFLEPNKTNGEGRSNIGTSQPSQH